MKLSKWLIDKLTRILEPELQDAVVGDVAELKMRDRRAVWELLGLVLRRQVPLWKTWGPWLALVGIVGPVVLLSFICLGVVSDFSRQALVYWQYRVPYSSGLTEAQEIETLVCVSSAVICWSWVGGFSLGTLSGKTFYVNGTLFYLVWFCLGGPLKILIYWVVFLLNASHPVPGPHGPTLLEFAFFAVVQFALITFLFLIPSFKGMQRARYSRKLAKPYTIMLAATCVTLTALVMWMKGWQHISLVKWSEGTWNPGAPSWHERLVPLFLSWPVLYLLVTLKREAPDRTWRKVGK